MLFFNFPNEKWFEKLAAYTADFLNRVFHAKDADIEHGSSPEIMGGGVVVVVVVVVVGPPPSTNLRTTQNVIKYRTGNKKHSVQDKVSGSTNCHF